MNPFDTDATDEERGGFGSELGGEPGVLSSSLPGNPHSSRGFRRALIQQQRHQGGDLKNRVAGHTLRTGGFPHSRFAQGMRPHGFHLSGAGMMHQVGSHLM